MGVTNEDRAKSIEASVYERGNCALWNEEGRNVVEVGSIRINDAVPPNKEEGAEGRVTPIQICSQW